MAELAEADLPVAQPVTVSPRQEKQRRWPRPPAGLWPLSIALQTLSAWLLTSYTYFFIDDWVFLAQARTQRFGLSYLREGLFQHFSPVSRILDKVLVDVAPGNFAFAHALQLVMYALALVAFAWVMRTILGNGWTAFAATILFGQSLFLMRLLNFWTTTANILPSTIFMLVAIGSYLRWREAHSRRWLAVLLAAFVGSLLDYETALLLPAYLLLILAVPKDDLSPRALLATLWRERSAWIAMALLEGLGLYNYYAHYYGSMPRPTPGQMLRYLELALIDGFVPAVMGIKDPQAAISHHSVVIGGCLLVIAATAGLWIYLRPRAWRCVAAFFVVFVITMAPIGFARIGIWGVGAGQELYYQQSLQFMFLVLAALAISSTKTRGPALPQPIAHLGRRLRGVPPLVAAMSVAAIGGYAALFVTSVHAMARASWEPHRARAYINAFRSSMRRATATTSSHPVLIDSEVPGDIVPGGFAPFNHYSELLPLIDPHVRFNAAGQPTYVLNLAGQLVPVRFRRLASGQLQKAQAGVLYEPGSTRSPALRNGSACVPPSGSAPWLHVPLSTATNLAPTATGLPYALSVMTRMPVGASVPVVLAGRDTRRPDLTFPANWSPGVQSHLVPLTIHIEVEAVDLALPAGGCVGNLALGEFSFAGSAP